MLLWQVMVAAARDDKIGEDSQRARQWVREHVPGLIAVPADERGRPYADKAGLAVPKDRPSRRKWPKRVAVLDLVDWEKEWPNWQDCLEALLWFAKRRERPPQPRSLADHIPLHVGQVVDRVLGRTRNGLLTDYFTEAAITVQLSGTFTATGVFKSLDEFWEAVFLSFFKPESIPHGSMCASCGTPFPPTRRRGQVSRQTLCDQCRLRQWREKNRRRIRELWREQKQRDRDATRGE
jgi:hypothetical protein